MGKLRRFTLRALIWLVASFLMSNAYLWVTSLNTSSWVTASAEATRALERDFWPMLIAFLTVFIMAPILYAAIWLHRRVVPRTSIPKPLPTPKPLHTGPRPRRIEHRKFGIYYYTYEAGTSAGDK